MVSFGNEFRYADSLFAAENFQYAALEYERVWFFTSHTTIRDRALIKKGLSQKAMGKYSEAALTFSRIPADGRTDSVNFITHYETSLCAFLAGDLFNAESRLFRMKEYVKDTHLLKQALFLEVIVFTEGEKWEDAFQSYLKYCRHRAADTSLFHVIRSENELHLKKERKALFLSLLLPGLGQTYAGKPGRGISSLLLTGAAVTYGVLSATQGLWLTTLFTGFTYTLRFYSGGTRYAMKLVHAKNDKIKREYKNALRDHVLRMEGGFK
jgi:TM2 domain-containing membrane protein YozV